MKTPLPFFLEQELKFEVNLLSVLTAQRKSPFCSLKMQLYKILPETFNTSLPSSARPLGIHFLPWAFSISSLVSEAAPSMSCQAQGGLCLPWSHGHRFEQHFCLPLWAPHSSPSAGVTVKVSRKCSSGFSIQKTPPNFQARRTKSFQQQSL